MRRQGAEDRVRMSRNVGRRGNEKGELRSGATEGKSEEKKSTLGNTQSDEVGTSSSLSFLKTDLSYGSAT